MCGRYATTRSAADLSALFEAVDQTATDDDAGTPRPRFNVAPTDLAPLVRAASDRQAADPAPAGRADPVGRADPADPVGRVLSLGRWGLLPHWATHRRQGARMINARAETVASTRAYRDAFAARRALVPVDGWFEWRRTGAGARQAFYLTPRDGSVLALAGLWSRWGPDRLLTFTVVTTAAVGDLRDVHDRMPLLLGPEVWDRWLTGDQAEDLLVPVTPERAAGMEIRPVGPAVGNVRNDGPELVKRVDARVGPDRARATLF